MIIILLVRKLRGISHVQVATGVMAGFKKVWSSMPYAHQHTENSAFRMGDEHYHRAVQWHYIEKLSNDTVPNHTLITTNHQALFIYNRTKIAG